MNASLSPDSIFLRNPAEYMAVSGFASGSRVSSPFARDQYATNLPPSDFAIHSSIETEVLFSANP